MRKHASLLRSGLAAAGLLAAAACAHLSQRPAELVQPAQTDRDVETIAILGTNDIHGALAPQELKTRETDGTPPVAYRSGGVATLASYVNELRAEFGSSLLWLDAGDEFQGSIESNLAQGAPLVQFFDLEGLQAAAIGNHEFDYGASHAPGADPADRLGALKERMSEARYPYLSANTLDKATHRLATAELPRLADARIFEAGKVKVGVIGLTTLDTPKTTTTVNVKDLEFADLAATAKAQAALLRQKGADLVVAVAHVGLKCERGRSPMASHLRTPTEPQGDCNPRDELVRMLAALPPGTLDAVVAGHSHQIVHHWVSGVPVIQGGAFGDYFNVIYLNYDLKKHQLLPELTRIEGPVPVCPLTFQNQGDCFGARPAPKGGRGPLVPTVFHGATITEDPAVTRLLAPTLARSADAKKEVVARLARPLDHDRFKESELGDLITDAMREASGAPVALMNSGGIRAPWEAGPLTYEAVFRTLPFDNQVVPLRVTGRELKLILRIAESGSRGFFSVSGVKLRLISPEDDAKGTDLNGDGRIDKWEENRLLGVELDDGKPIVDDQTYVLATLDFLINGGDDLGWIMEQIPASRQDPPSSLLRDAVVKHLKRLAQSGPINTYEHPVFDPANPRMKFEKTKEKAKGRRGRAHRRRHRKKS